MQKYIIEYETKNMWSVMFNRSPKKTVSVLICVKKKKKLWKHLMKVIHLKWKRRKDLFNRMVKKQISARSDSSETKYYVS